MRKISLIAIAVCLLLTSAYSQKKKFDFKLGAEYGLPKKAEDLTFFGNESDGIVNFSLKKDDLFVTRFHPKTLALTYERQIDLGNVKNMNSEMIVSFGNRYYWLRSDWEKEREREILYSNEVDVKTGKIDKAQKTLIESKKLAGNMAMTGFYQYKKTDKYQITYNAQKDKLLVTYRLVPENRKDKNSFDIIGVFVFNDKMEKIWGQEFTMPYNEAVMDNNDYALDANGNAYLLAKVYASASRKEVDKATGLPGYHLEVFKFTSNHDQVLQAKVSVGDAFIKESSLVESTTGDIVIASTYSNKAKGIGTAGFFLGIIGPDGKITNYKKGKYEFPKEELQKFEKASQRRKIKNKDDYEPGNLYVRDIIIEQDGSILISLEEHFVRVRNYYDPSTRTSRETITYHYNDILAARLNAAGDFEWIRKVAKNQRGTRGRGTMSFKLISDHTGYYFLYLDNLKNLELEEDDTPKTHIDGLGGQVFVSKIDNNGKVTKEVVFNTRSEDVMIFPADFTKINNNQFIGRARLKKTLFQPLLITVN
ncbi:MAG: hypothetical protein KIT80_14495 [Chitinophagaceae bacterium]|nr:hypothetical protein [Chitinophagaceae bacterium]MCW5928123.1 hypothetical protein [Chitinophagaceae bacterium]